MWVQTLDLLWNVFIVILHKYVNIVRIMWPNIIYMMPLLLTNKYLVSCEIMQYFHDVRYWYIEIDLLDLVDWDYECIHYSPWLDHIHHDVAYFDMYIVGPWWKGGAS